MVAIRAWVGAQSYWVLCHEHGAVLQVDRRRRVHDGLHSSLNSVLVLGSEFDFGRLWHLHLALESVAGGADPVAAPVPVLVRRR